MRCNALFPAIAGLKDVLPLTGCAMSASTSSPDCAHAVQFSESPQQASVFSAMISLFSLAMDETLATTRGVESNKLDVHITTQTLRNLLLANGVL